MLETWKSILILPLPSWPHSGTSRYFLNPLFSHNSHPHCPHQVSLFSHPDYRNILPAGLLPLDFLPSDLTSLLPPGWVIGPCWSGYLLLTLYHLQTQVLAHTQGLYALPCLYFSLISHCSRLIVYVQEHTPSRSPESPSPHRHVAHLHAPWL